MLTSLIPLFLLTTVLTIYPKFPFSEMESLVLRQQNASPTADDDNKNFKPSGSLSKSATHPRILQGDNPFSPTGDIMTTTPGVKPDDDVLTIDVINQIAQSNGIVLRPNVTTNTTDPLYTIGNNVFSLNISILGQSNSTNMILGNQTWTQAIVD